MIKKPKVLAFLIYYFVFTVLGIIFRGKINFIWMQLLFHFFCILIIILMLFKIRRKIFYVLSFLSSFVCFLFGTLFIIMICYGNSMAPNHYNKAILFFWQQDFKVERNDVVAVKYPENWDLDYQINFKRIIGVPGDEVRFEGNYILINGRKLWYWEGHILAL